MESLTLLQFSWLGSQAWQHYIHRKEGDELCIIGLKPKQISQPRAAPSALALEEAQCMDSFPGYLCANKSGSLGLSTGDMHPGFLAGSAANCTHVWLPYLNRALSLRDDSLDQINEGGERRKNNQCFPGITISGSRQSFIGAIIAQATICPHFQITSLGFSFNGCCVSSGCRELVICRPLQYRELLVLAWRFKSLNSWAFRVED